MDIELLERRVPVTINPEPRRWMMLPMILGREEGRPAWTWVSWAVSLPAPAGTPPWEQRLVRRMNRAG